MDEKDLAEHQFRDANLGSKSLDDFARVENNEDIYQEYREQAKKDKKLSYLEEVKQKLSQEKIKEQKLQQLYQEASGNIVDYPSLDEHFKKEAKGEAPISHF